MRLTQTLPVLCIAILFWLFSDQLYAQPQVDPPPLSSDEFPIGPFELSTLNWGSVDYSADNHPTILFQKMNEAGFNLFYSGNRPGGWTNWQTQDATYFPKGMNIYLGATYSEFEYKYIGNRFGIPGAEIRDFLASYENDNEFDVERNWLNEFLQSGHFSYWTTVKGSAVGSEWLIDRSTSGTLLDLDLSKSDQYHGPQQDLFYYGGDYDYRYTHDHDIIETDDNGNFVADHGPKYAYVDFIYRLDGSQPSSNAISTRPNDPLFAVNYDASLPTTSDRQIIITYQKYLDQINSGSYAPKESPYLTKFPAPKAGIASQPYNYAIARMKIDITQANHLVLTILTSQSPGIYVRGFRIRSKVADKILTGGWDYQIRKDASAIKTAVKSVSSSAWDHTRGIALGGEMTYEGFRTLAYVDQIVAKQIREFDYSFLSTNITHNNYPWYRAIYEDQTDKPPTTIMQENFEMFQKGQSSDDPPFVASDAIPFAYRQSGSNFIDLGFPIKQGVVGSGTDRFQGYLDYTSNMQGYLSKFDELFGTAADAAFKKAPATKWYTLLSTILNFRNSGDSKDCNGSTSPTYPMSTIRSTDIGGGKTLLDRIIEGAKSGNITDYLEQNHHIDYSWIWKTDHLGLQYWGSGCDMLVSSRGPSKSEIRAETWDALAWGATGLFFNNVGSDGGEQIGISDNVFNTDYDGNIQGSSTEKGLIWYGSGDCNNPFIPQSSFTHYLIHKTFPSSCTGNTDYDGVWDEQWVPVSFDLSQHTLGYYLDNNNINVINKVSGNPQRDVNPTPSKLPCIDGWAPTTLGDFWDKNWGGCGDHTSSTDRAKLAYFFDVSDPRVVNGTWPNYYPYSHVQFKVPIPTFYGFHERWIGAKQSVSDVIPVGKRLSELRWQEVVNYSQVTSLPTDFPITSIHSLKFEPDDYQNRTLATGSESLLPESGAEDVQSKSYYTLTQFSDPTEDLAHFILVLNRRMWPINYASDGSVVMLDKSASATNSSLWQNMLGAVDARRFTFEPYRNVLDPSQLYTYYSVTNLRTGVEEVKKFSDNSNHPSHSIDFEPGEGTLLRISPATSFPVGKSSPLGMAYNNGHRIADFKNNQRIIVWERKGNIQYNITNNPHQSTEDNYSEEANANSFGNFSDARNPSVAVKHQSTCTSGTCYDTVAIVFSDGIQNGTQQAVLFEWGVRPVSSGTSTVDVTWRGSKVVFTPSNGDPCHDSNHPDRFPTPSVVPTKDGFFLAWSDPSTSDIRPMVVTISSSGGNSISSFPLNTQHADPNSLCALFPSVASRRDWADFPNDPERLYLVWEEQFNPNGSKPNSQIYYQRFDYNAVNNAFLSQYSQPERVTKDAPYCEHHHPNVAVVDSRKWQPIIVGGQQEYVIAPAPGEPIVTWEMVESRCNSKLEFGNATNNVVVALRSRDALPPVQFAWGSFTTFYPKKDNLPLPQIRVKTTGASSLDPSDDQAVVFQDTFTRQIHMERISSESTPSDNSLWQHHQLRDKGLYPNQSLQFDKVDGGNARTFAFRGIDRTYSSNSEDDGLFAVRINARNVGDETSIRSSLTQTISVSSSQSSCNKGLTYSIGDGGGCSTCPTTNPPDTNHKWKYNTTDITHVGMFQVYPPPAKYWPRTEDSIRTNMFTVQLGDSIRFERELAIDDSAWISETFPSQIDTLSMLLVLKDSVSHQVVDTLDGIIIQGGTTPTITSIKVPFPPPVPAPPVDCPPIAKLAHVSITHPVDNPSRIPTSGKGYLTIISNKDTSSTLYLSQIQEHDRTFQDNYVYPVTDTGFKKPSTPSVSYITNPLEISVYPNPFTLLSAVDVSGAKGMPLTIGIYDLLGREVKGIFNDVIDNPNLRFILDASYFASGNYYLRAQSGNFVKTIKLEVKK
ncbi:MAG: T9SS type A sorting domain-containing protein [Bacteroidetes bacterium]|nr:T9SS type A sorting domain-containing protein [Bacteroidota bacterium]